jgi:hypothetical protein
MQQRIKIYFIFVRSSTCFVSGDTPPITGSLKLHWQPLVVHTCIVVGRVVAGHCQQLHGQQPSTYAQPEAAIAVLGF